MLQMGIFVPFRLVFCHPHARLPRQTAQGLCRAKGSRGSPGPQGSCPSGLPLPRGVGSGAGGQESRDVLQVPGGGGSGLPLPSPADHQPGRRRGSTRTSTRGTASVTPPSASIGRAGSRRRKAGTSPKLQSGSCHCGSRCRRAGSRRLAQELCRALPCSAPVASVAFAAPLPAPAATSTNPFASPGRGSCSYAPRVRPEGRIDAARR